METENINIDKKNYQQQIESLLDFQVFKKIFLSPKKAFRYITKAGFERYSSLLVVLFGLSYCLDLSIEKEIGNTFSPLAFIIFLAIVSPIVGFLYLNIYAIFLGITGGWLGGKASINQFSKVLPYAALPSIIGILYIALSVLVSGFQIFVDVETLAIDNPVVGLVISFILISKGVLGIWTMVLIIIAVAEIQSFSIRRALLNVILPAILLVAIIAGILLFFRTFAFLEKAF